MKLCFGTLIVSTVALVGGYGVGRSAQKWEEKPSTLHVRGIVVENESGQPIISLGARHGQRPHMRFLDPNSGNPVLELGESANQAGYGVVRIFSSIQKDEAEVPLVYMGASFIEASAPHAGTVSVHQLNGDGAATLVVYDDGKGALAVYGNNGEGKVYGP